MKPVRIGVAGLGNFGEVAVRTLSLMAEYDLVGVASRNGERAQQVAGKYGARRWYADPRDLANDPEVEAVYVVTDLARHVEVAQTMLTAGKHVLIEKPLTARIEEADAIVRAAAAANRLVMVGYIERFDPRRAMIHQRIAAGELGEIVSLYGRRNIGNQYLSWPRFQRWPLIIEPGIHTVDMLLWLAGSRVRRVYAVGRSHNEWKTTDTWWATLEFANGAVGVIEQVWHLPAGTAADWDQDNQLEVIGTKGTAQMRDPTDAFWVWTSGATRSPDFYLLPEVAGQITGALRNEFAYFARCVATGEPPALGTLAEAYHTTQVALAIVESAQKGTLVEINK
ncbi:MAG: Gfo/Idh/MocA family oxidoreductase [Anaerolineae bacterium]|nr:Gfo/Idh/MocA family oxidoreductase [Anaerolineae bacterium]